MFTVGRVIKNELVLSRRIQINKRVHFPIYVISFDLKRMYFV